MDYKNDGIEGGGLMRRYFICSIIILIGCALGSFMPTDTIIERAYNSGQIRIGSTKEEVAQVIVPTYSGCIKQKITEQGVLELWDFATKICGANFMNSYALVFRDGILIEIRKVNNIYDLNL